MNKIAVVSFIDVNSSQENKLLGHKCSLINRKYCQINNYDYYYDQYNNNVKKTQNQTFDDPTNRNYLDNILICKFLIIKKYLKNYDFVFFIDYDAVFVNPNIKIQTFLDQLHDVYISRGNNKLQHISNILKMINIFQNIKNSKYMKILEDDFYSGLQLISNDFKFDILRKIIDIGINPNGITGGVFIFRNSQYGYKILNQCIQHSKIFTHLSSSMQQSSLGFFTFKDFSRTKLLPDNTQAHVNGGFLARYDQNSSFIMHNYGLYNDIDKKIELIDLVKNNKWWKNYLI